MDALKPKCKILDTDGNIFMILGRVRTTLKKHGLKEKVQEVTYRVLNDAKSYYHALEIVTEYITVE